MSTLRTNVGDQRSRTRLSFAFVDVFAAHPLAGAPLSLVVDADGLDESQMRAIAREFNQSETTFLLRPSLPGATWRLRSFTPIGVEVLVPATTPWVPGYGWRLPAGCRSGTKVRAWRKRSAEKYFRWR